ncbi:hypothetical protein [Kitasatospora sp. DSM 101779]|uniref:hypothetical protein n=1 Tax=Kitasatospora sp. DSM 101779 TaxID=2853165 RepID=UPI0021D8D394|nr:hypothetical protein [Kitasatospora sp. DSM 101779]MCU7826585.1 hypothetical protein [Kitasatospora sp. DSM 101779]
MDASADTARIVTALAARWAAELGGADGSGTVFTAVGVWPLLGMPAAGADHTVRKELEEAIGLPAGEAARRGRELLALLGDVPGAGAAVGLWTAARLRLEPQSGWPRSARTPAAPSRACPRSTGSSSTGSSSTGGPGSTPEASSGPCPRSSTENCCSSWPVPWPSAPAGGTPSTKWGDRMGDLLWAADRTADAIVLCHLGCGRREWLGVSGPERGRIWSDDRIDDLDLAPLLDPDGRPVTFARRYLDWLHEAEQYVRQQAA